MTYYQSAAGIKRLPQNPLLTPANVVPSRPDFRVEGVFNCGVIKYGGDILLLCRIAESISSSDPDVLQFPVVRGNNGKIKIAVERIVKSQHPELCFDDSRVVTDRASGKIVCLTSLSHFRLAHSKDGIHFSLQPHPTILPDPYGERWGIEDPRIVCIDGKYVVTYTASSPYGAVVSMMETTDFETFEKRGAIFLPENKDVTIFPEKVRGEYIAFSRPVPASIGEPDIWLSRSPDLFYWGNHSHFCGVSKIGWESGRIGGGAPPFLTEKGWVAIYHAADRENRYSLGAMLLDREDPSKILARSQTPLLYPEKSYETGGFFGGVVFSCGCLLEKKTVEIYYGAADDKICRADISLDDLFCHLGV